MNLTPKDDPDYAQLEHALSNHQKGLTKIDDRIWVEEHNEMLKDLQQRIKGLPSVRCSSLYPFFYFLRCHMGLVATRSNHVTTCIIYNRISHLLRNIAT